STVRPAMPPLPLARSTTARTARRTWSPSPEDGPRVGTGTPMRSGPAGGGVTPGAGVGWPAAAVDRPADLEAGCPPPGAAPRPASAAAGLSAPDGPAVTDPAGAPRPAAVRTPVPVRSAWTPDGAGGVAVPSAISAGVNCGAAAGATAASSAFSTWVTGRPPGGAATATSRAT